jgi:hypothetical protein
MGRRASLLLGLLVVLLLVLASVFLVPRWLARPGEEATDIIAFLSDPSGKLPQPIKVDDAVEQILALHAEYDGSTFNMYFGDLGGKELYAVSLYPDLGIVLEGKEIPPDVLRRFISDNDDLFKDPRVSVGTWFDSEGGMTYLDISATIPDRQQAIELGRQYNQIAIFDLSTFEEIDTGGTGEAIENVPPPTERLPKLVWD